MVAAAHGYSAAMQGSMQRGRERALQFACLALCAGLAAGCGTGAPASASSWQSSADRALGQALAGLGTARLALELESRDRAPHAYTVVTATDAVDTTSQAASGFQVAQPPDRLHRANKVVNDALAEAVSLLVEVRVTVASPGIDRAEAGRLMDRIDALRTKVDDLDSQVKSSPGSVSGP